MRKVILLIAFTFGEEQTNQNAAEQADTPMVQEPETDFSTLSRERFDSLVADVNELESITCLPESCTNVAYFNYLSVPDDLEMIIRGNAASFSKFKLDQTGTSNVTVFGVVVGVQVLRCDAAKGVVTQCTK